MIPAVSFAGVALGYGTVPVLARVDLTVAPGEVVAVLGPSGSGKTTLLHAVAGFVAPSAGQISLAGRRASGGGRCDPPEKRRVGMVFQNYALWPHLAVVDIVAYPIRRHGVAAGAARRRAMDLLARLDIAGLAGRRPAELSGGEQQRVGLARALAADPRVFLFDEPTAHLDAHLRTVVLAEVAEQRAATGAAALYATHDSAEALAIADRVAVLHSGRVAQVATPAEVYGRPADLTVARLTGPVSVLDAPVRATASGTVTIDVGGAAATARCGESDAARCGGSGAAPILVRPDWAALDGDLPGLVTAVRFGGPHTDYEIETPVGPVLIRESGPPRRVPGETTGWSLDRVWPAGPADGSALGARQPDQDGPPRCWGRDSVAAMAYDEALAERIRERMRHADGVTEKKMFGGLAFMTYGNMTVGVIGDDLMVRVGPDATDTALTRPGAREFDFTGRPMKGWVVVDGTALDDEILAGWIDQGAAFVATLPPK